MLIAAQRGWSVLCANDKDKKRLLTGVGRLVVGLINSYKKQLHRKRAARRIP